MDTVKKWLVEPHMLVGHQLDSQDDALRAAFELCETNFPVEIHTPDGSIYRLERTRERTR